MSKRKWRIWWIHRDGRPEALNKVEFIRGDCLVADNWGIGDEDLQKIVDEVDVIFNCASSSLFDISLKQSGEINVRALSDFLEISKRMKHLKAFVHVSNAYVNCNAGTLSESLAKPFISGRALIEFVQTMDTAHVSNSTPIVVGKWLNNYIFTKSIAEDIIRKDGKLLPIAVVRPAMLISSAKEPVPGWLDNVNGVTGLIMTIYLGLNKSLLVQKNVRADVIPADYAANALIAAAWDIAKTKTLNENSEYLETNEYVPVYNLVGSKEHPITWGRLFKLASKHGKLLPTIYTISYPWCIFHGNKRLHSILVAVLHYIPAYLFDLFGFYFYGKARYLGYYNKVDMLSRSLKFVLMKGWESSGEATKGLWNKLSATDKALFDFDMDSVDWDSYFQSYIAGIRMYVLKDTMDTLPEGVQALKSSFLWMLATFGVALLFLFHLLIL
ncbi:PREDICTED: fatty acyl-CoA reductase 1-like isoform X2 [Nicrophorus vespilloides]|uniref:Fatty acyl-CoA reductase n=1 Tax=Nicrophorus vespilloides TaxID=110193 RepID=A0ABM1M7Z3_NICVS|nr:PREDICTED: fatty acyl-CoA reductase 1-like isoform X2 [Nicrophorus vespilloides]